MFHYIQNINTWPKYCFYRRRPNEESVKKIQDKHFCPANIPNATVPRTNPVIWDNLSRGVQVADSSTQRVQLNLAHALSAQLEVINAIGRNRAGMTETHLETLTDTTRLITASFSSLNQVRKELIRNSMGMPLAKFCNWEQKVGEELMFPDLSKLLKERDDTQFKLRRKSKFR